MSVHHDPHHRHKLLPTLRLSTCPWRHVARSLRPESGKPCYMVVKPWAPNAADLQWLRRNDRLMIRWICGVDTRDEVPSTTLLLKLGLKETSAALRTYRLRWFGHVQRASSCINTICEMAIPGVRGAGRPRKTWSECVKNGRRECNLSNTDPQDRDAWRAGVRLA